LQSYERWSVTGLKTAVVYYKLAVHKESCHARADHMEVLKRVSVYNGEVGDFANDADLRNLIAEWVDYRIDA